MMSDIRIYTKVVAPAGRCPVELNGTDDESILDWARKVRASSGNTFYTREALQYWVRQFYDPNNDTEMWNFVRGRLKDLIDPLDNKKAHRRRRGK